MMNISKKRKIGVFFAFMLFACAAIAQYNVMGGSGTPLMAVDNDSRMQVYLVYGTENLQISYTSSSTSHQWYRYKTRALDDSEKIASTQNGTTSVITNVEDGYGYYVGEQENVAMNRFVWIIDYSKYEFDIRSFNVSSPDTAQCMSVRFAGDADIADMIYHNPNGAQEKVKREFELRYETLEWNDVLKSFSNKSVNQVFNTDPFLTSFPLNQKARFLKDTEIMLTGDLFARHFGVEKSMSIPYEAKMIEVHVDSFIISSGTSNIQETGEGESELLSPAVVRFKAYANLPVASLFQWRIYKNEETRPIIYTTEDAIHTFDRTGEYVVKLEVLDRSGYCSNEDDEEGHTFKINITDTEMIIPNAFSPGCTPGINDIFKVRYKSVDRFNGRVFNRWGTELFHWTDPSQGWDGKYRGKYVSPGAYYYLIEYTGTDGKKRARKGDINVFRSKTIDTEIRTGE